MQVYALEMDDFCEEEYSLIGIHSTLEDYKLAYFLNRNLNAKLSKTAKDLEFIRRQKKATFSLYSYDCNNGYCWSLIANSYRRENQTVSNELLLTTETKTYLIPEKKKVDFFLKICGCLEYEFVLETIQKIKKIDNVITAYSIDKNTLKSKDFLIF
ncbi:IPExxxVDY family protein [Polaribacter sp. WD7]|uniref:IPExxxVDY family protein n=1 Tax=Polaribacter sp. WD7 TaxID=2269061 RepID=UPI000DF37572|nr:IPExxxVDY family protein [Polaribacter sp. WD7]RCS26025.1 IPExxxVDY family protein [Polaribacter sp. WD7]